MKTKPNITLFHCINAFEETSTLKAGKENDKFNLKIVKMACSGMTKDIFILKAFEAGADAVIVMVCPEEACRYTEGSIRAAKRVRYVKNLLDEIGLDGKRLSIHNVTMGDEEAVEDIITTTLGTVAELGRNPAA